MNLLNLTFTLAVVIFITALFFFIVYFLNKKNKKREAAIILLDEIKSAELLPNGNKLIPPPLLIPKQIDLCKRLDDFYRKNKLRPFKPNPSEIYMGAIYCMQSVFRNNPDWVSQVAHSLRELLYPLWYEVRSHKKVDRAPVIKGKFKQYGSVFVEEVFDEINEVYGKLNDLAHHGLEPQVFTEEELSKFSDNAFEELVSRFEDLMFQAFTITLNIFEQIDQLFSKNPAEYHNGEAIRNNIKQLIKERSAKEYFFYKANKGWLNWLWDNGFLDVIRQKAKDQTRYGYRTPELSYLVQMAEKKPVKVVDIILAVPVTNEMFNPEVVDRFLHICSILSARQLKRLVKKIYNEEWIPLMGKFSQWGYEYEKMFKTLANAKDYRSILILAEAVLSVRTNEEIESAAKRTATDNPFYFSDLTVTKVFEYLADIPDRYAERALALTTKSMAHIVLLGSKVESGSVFTFEDKFHLFDVDFFTLNPRKMEHLSHQNNVCELSAVIKVLIQSIIRDQCDKPEDVRAVYEKHIRTLPDSRAIWRLRLFVLSLCPDIFKKELRTAFFRLFEAERYLEILSGAEYYKALQKGFSELSENDKRNYIKQAITYFKKHTENKKNEDWHSGYGSRIFSMITDYLDINIDLKRQVEEAGFTIDRGYEPSPSMGPVKGGFVVPRGPITQGEFSKFSTADIANKLRTDWTPEKLSKQKTSDDFLNPINAEGAGKLLQTDIPKRLQDYVRNAALYFEYDVLDQHYTYCFLQGIQEAIKSNIEASSKVNWAGFIRLCVEVKKQGEARFFESGRRGRDSFDAWLADWDTVHSGITDVLQELLNERDGFVAIDVSKYREQLFEIISYLLDHHDPTPEEEQIETANMKTKSPGDPEYLISDPFTIAINTVRGRAFQAFVLFVRQNSKQFTSKSVIKISYEAKQLYEKVLEKEKTRAIMFMYGHYLPTFYFMDRKWLLGLLPKLFPEIQEKKYHYMAAWEGYLVNSIYNELFFEPEIQSLYERYLVSTKIEYPKQNYFRDPNESIAIHFAVAYMYCDNFRFGHNLFDLFWGKNNLEQHINFISFIGRSFISGDNLKANELLEKEPRCKQQLEELWDWLLEGYKKPILFVEFGFWINLEKDIFKTIWLAERVKKTLEMTKGILDWDLGLMNSITTFAKEAPNNAIIIARLYLLEGCVRGNNNQMMFSIDQEWLKALELLYKNPKTKFETYTLINDLIREGSSVFWRLKMILGENN